jgi:hypothetical protein
MQECAEVDTRNLLYLENRAKQRLEQWKQRTGRGRKSPSATALDAQKAREFIEWEQAWKQSRSKAGGTDS